MATGLRDQTPPLAADVRASLQTRPRVDVSDAHAPFGRAPLGRAPLGR
jgi:hypothetical protein